MPGPQPEPRPTSATRRAVDLYAGNREPALRDLLSDPLTKAVMARDGVSPRALCAVVASVRGGDDCPSEAA